MRRGTCLAKSQLISQTCGERPDNLFVHDQLDSDARPWTDIVVHHEVLPRYDADVRQCNESDRELIP